MTEASLLDLVAPPPGYAFTCGVWLTHDISAQAVNRWLVPALVGMGVDSTSTAVAGAPAALLPGALTVVAAGDRINTAAAYPDVVTLIPHVDGARRLHAKVAVLSYTRTNAKAGTATGGTLTLVTSANITRGGLTRNREVFAAEWLPSNSGRPCLAFPVLQALRAFKNSMPTSRQKTVLGSRIEELWKSLPSKATGQAGVLAESLTAMPAIPLHQELLEQYVDPDAVTRVTLIGPAFADDHADVATHLAWMLRPGVKVNLVVDTHLGAQDIRKHGGHVAVPTGLLDGLKARVGAENVEILASAANDPSGATRRLHGKAITVHADDGAYSVVGSGNITVRGLTGRTREMVVLVDHHGPHDPTADLNCVTVPADQIVATTRHDTLPDGVAATEVPLMAVFYPDPGQHAGVTALKGTLVVADRKTGTIELPDGSIVRLIDGEAEVTLDPGDLRLTWQGTGASRRLAITIEPDYQEFWSGVPLDLTPTPVDPLLALLQHDIARALRPPKGAKGAGHAHADDGFHLPLNNRLNVLTRYRGALESLAPDRLDTILRQFFDDEPEHRVATTVALARRGTASGTGYAFLDRLSELIATMPVRETES